MPDLSAIPPAPEIDEMVFNNPELIEVFSHDIEYALLNSNMNSAPGPDKITYFHLRSCFNANKKFFTEMISRVINNQEYDNSFSTMTIIPI